MDESAAAFGLCPAEKGEELETLTINLPPLGAASAVAMEDYK
jgi:hypothetical protein